MRRGSPDRRQPVAPPGAACYPPPGLAGSTADWISTLQPPSRKRLVHQYALRARGAIAIVEAAAGHDRLLERFEIPWPDACRPEVPHADRFGAGRRLDLRASHGR